MAFREIYTGGACGAEQNQQSHQRTNNPFHNFMNQMFYGPAQNREKLEGFGPQDQQFQNIHQDMMDRQAAFQTMNKEWDILAKEFDQKGVIDPLQMKMMEDQWHNEQKHHEEMMKLAQENAWNEANEQYKAEQWANNFQMEQAFEEAKQEQNQEIKDPNHEQNVIKKSAIEMIEVMKNDPEERFKNSKFLQFLVKLDTGELKIENNQLITNTGPQTGDKILDQIFSETEQKLKDQPLQNKEELGMQEAWEESKQQFNNDLFQGGDEAFEKLLDEQYMKVLKDLETAGGEGNFNEIFADSWQKATDLEEQMIYKDVSDVYTFNTANPFLNMPKPLVASVDLIAQGKTSEAILAMEAHLQKNEKDAQTWRILGKLHQENDQDQKAVSCLLNALKLEPDNLDTLLALGISCTNILDEVKAMDFLCQWMRNNKNYHSLNLNTDLVPQNRLYDDFKIEEIKDINAATLKMFQEARNLHPDDPDLLTSLSVLHFIARDYENSVILFKEALKFDTSNYSLWNKLGATLAHLGRADEAIEAYHKALDLKPNYVRVWVNLGIAHAYKGEYEDAARFYLNALSFNPEAKHVWNYLQTTFVCMQRFDLVPKIAHQDVKAFADQFDVMRVEDLPQPEIEYVMANNKFIIKEDINKWVNEFSDVKEGI